MHPHSRAARLAQCLACGRLQQMSERRRVLPSRVPDPLSQVSHCPAALGSLSHSSRAPEALSADCRSPRGPQTWNSAGCSSSGLRRVRQGHLSRRWRRRSRAGAGAREGWPGQEEDSRWARGSITTGGHDLMRPPSCGNSHGPGSQTGGAAGSLHLTDAEAEAQTALAACPKLCSCTVTGTPVSPRGLDEIRGGAEWK